MYQAASFFIFVVLGPLARLPKLPRRSEGIPFLLDVELQRRVKDDFLPIGQLYIMDVDTRERITRRVIRLGEVHLNRTVQPIDGVLLGEGATAEELSRFFTPQKDLECHVSHHRLSPRVF